MLSLKGWKIEDDPVLIDESDRFIDEKKIWGHPNSHRDSDVEIDRKIR